MMMDAIVGMSVVVILLLALTQAASLQRKATERLADQRTALSIASRLLAALEAGGSLPPLDDPATKVSLSRIATPVPMRGHDWIQITVEHLQAREELTTLAPSAAIDAAIKALEVAP